MGATQMSLFSGLAVKDVLETSVLPILSRDHGIKVTTTFEPTAVLVDLIAQGNEPDVMIGVHSGLAQLVNEGVLSQESIAPLVRSGMGVAVPAGAVVPRIDTVDDFVSLLRNARSVAYSRTGASGIYFADLLEQLKIADEVNERACIVNKGFTAETLVDGRADVAVQQLIELAAVDGPRVVGPLPPDVQHYVQLSVAAGARTPHLSQVGRFIEFLFTPMATKAFRAAGLEAVISSSSRTTKNEAMSPNISATS